MMNEELESQNDLLKNTSANLNIFNSSLLTIIMSLKYDDEKLTREVSALKSIVEKFTNGKQNVEIMLERKEVFLTRSELDIKWIHLEILKKVTFERNSTFSS